MTREEVSARISKDMPLINSIITKFKEKFKVLPQSREQLIQESMIKYWEIMNDNRYDKSKGSFSTFLTKCLENKFHTINTKNKRKRKIILNTNVNLNNLIKLNYNTIEKDICFDKACKVAEERIGSLEFNAIKLSADGHRLEDISKIIEEDFGIKYSCEALSIMIDRKKNKLKNIFKELREMN